MSEFDFNDDENNDDYLASTVRDDIYTGPRLAYSNVDQNPETGARAIRLAQATGVPAPAIFGNIDPFESQTKADMAANIVRNSPELDEYVKRNALASVVSNDDYGSLSDFSSGANQTKSMMAQMIGPGTITGNLVAGALGLNNILVGAAKGAVEGAGPGWGNLISAEDWKNHPVVAPIASLLLAPAEAIQRGFGFAGGAITGGVTAATQQVTGDTNLAQSVAREIGGMMESEFGRAGGGGLHPAEGQARALQMREGLERAAPWIENGQEVPNGVHPIIDEMKAKLNANAIESLQQDLTNAETTLTKGRAPELFQKFAEQHYGDQTVSLPADKAIELYGDKVPSSGDNLLGWVPFMADRLEAARTVGVDVQILISDLVTKMDPKVFNDVKDDLRVQGGISATEAKELPEPHAVIDAPLSQVRDTSGLEPVYGIGDRKLTLEPSGDGAFNVVGPDGKPAGTLAITPDGNITLDGQAGLLADTISPSGIADLEKQLTAAGHDVTLPQGDQWAPVEGVDRDQWHNLRASALGLDKTTYDRMQRRMQAQQKADIVASEARAERQQRKSQTAEWKAQTEEFRVQAEAAVRKQLDVSADLAIGSGEISGNKLRQRFPLREADLSDEQKAALPDHYYSKDGLSVDGLADQLGFASGNEMVERLAAYQKLKDGRTPQEMVKHLTDTVTAREMESRLGRLEDNVMVAARDQALSENSLNILHDEYVGKAIEHNTTVIDRGLIETAARDAYNKMELGYIDADRFMAQLKGLSDKALKAFADGRSADGVKLMQQRVGMARMAKMAVELRKERQAFAKTMAPLARRFDFKDTHGIDPNYSIFLRDIAGKIGERNGFDTPMGLAQAIENTGSADLASFVQKLNTEGEISGLGIPLNEALAQAGDWKKVDNMTPPEFAQLKRTVDMLNKLGRMEDKIQRNNVVMNLDMALTNIRTQLSMKFAPVSGAKVGAGLELLSHFLAASTSMETLFHRFDGRDLHGYFTETFVYPGARSANREVTLQREFQEKYAKLGAIPDGDRTLPSIFKHPRTGVEIPATRTTLHVVLSNLGNDYNWRALTKGWGLGEQELFDWAEKHSTPEDLQRVQGLGKLFDDAKEQLDNVDSQVFGAASENVPPRPFTMHGKEWPGWFHPIIDDPLVGKDYNKPNTSGEPRNYYPVIPDAFTKHRTGADHVISLDYDAVPMRLGQYLHAIAFRDFVHNSSKLIKSDRFSNAVRDYYGKPYMDQINNWLERVAGSASYNASELGWLNTASRILRKNVVSTEILFGANTIQKHGLSAFVNSGMISKNIPKFLSATVRVSPSLFKGAVQELYSKDPHVGNSLSDFIYRSSDEIKRRTRDPISTVPMQHLELHDPSLYRDFKNTLAKWGTAPLALSDRFSAEPTWLVAYEKEMAENGGDHNASVDVADFAVRRAHGSTAITNIPGIATSKGPLGPWLTTVYGFMGTMLQRRIELAHDINDAYKLGRSGEIAEAAKMVPAITAKAMAYVVWPAVVENWVSGRFTDDRRGTFEKVATFIGGMFANTLIGFRDLQSDLEYGTETVGQFGSPIHDIAYLTRDIKHMVEHGIKGDPVLTRHEAGTTVQHAISLLGDLTGLGSTPLGKMAKFGIDLYDHEQSPPQTAGKLAQGLITGKQQNRIQR